MRLEGFLSLLGCVLLVVVLLVGMNALFDRLRSGVAPVASAPPP